MRRKRRLVLGTMRVAGDFDGFVLHQRRKRSAAEFLEAAIARGARTFDTAPIYGLGEAERLLAPFAANREVRIWTKVGVRIGGVLPQLDYTLAGYWRSIEGSLHRLSAQRVDTIFLHNPPARAIESDDWARFAEDVLKAGLTSHIGISILARRELKPALGRENHALMIERSLTQQSRSLQNALSRRDETVVVRSVFFGGAEFRSRESKRAIIDRAFKVLSETFPAAFFVVAPRTLRQLGDYDFSE